MPGQTKRGRIKCLVWDLDNTLWDGTLLEDEHVHLKPGVQDVIQTLDARGILHSIASKNEPDPALRKLAEFGLAEYFLYPQINWNSKAASIQAIAEALNIGLDAIAFIDDQLYERAEVAYSFPQVFCLSASELDNLLTMPEFNPRWITTDSKMRRHMYQADIQRKQLEEAFTGPQAAFLASLQMRLDIFPAGESDLARAEELTVRTHQLNSTGQTYSYAELDQFRHSKQHKLLMARLEDRFGNYGNIGLALLACGADTWEVKLLLMSCRVMSRGVGSVLLIHIMQLAREKGVQLRADFIPNDRNRLMEITYRFAGFEETCQSGAKIVFQHSLEHIPAFPDYLVVRTHE